MLYFGLNVNCDVKFNQVFGKRRNTQSLDQLYCQNLHMFFKLGVLKNVANFTGKHLCWSMF